MYEHENTYQTALPTATTTNFLPKVYGWMTGGLALTALLAPGAIHSWTTGVIGLQN